MIEFIFWISLLLVVYPHLVYPVLLYVLPRKAKGKQDEGAAGPVAIVCSLYNEEKVIARKIENFYRLDYGDVELYLGLDGCTDNTMAEIRRAVRDDRVKVFSYPRGGKVSVLIALLNEVHQPFVVMTDANSMFRPDAVTRLMERMKEGVGVICGRLVLADEAGQSGEGIYWRIETFIKKVESDFGSVIGANGAIYLFRRELFEPLPPNTINDDFSISMRIYERGHAVVYAQDAIAEEQLVTSDAEEFRRHVRDAAGHFRAMAYLWRLLNPFRGKRFFFYFSHRVLRWAVPFLLLIALVSNAFLAVEYPTYRVILALHCAGYALMAAVHFMGIRWKPLYIPYYFMLVNAAILLGFFKNTLGLQKTAWESTRR
jgi:cellulose synthase/poly-beta-1,6-N-acetylglucosamine synthase-like glycosyltransferase